MPLPVLVWEGGETTLDEGLGLAEGTDEVCTGALELDATELDATCELDEGTAMLEDTTGSLPVLLPLLLNATGGPGLVKEWKLSAQMSGNTVVS